MTDQVLAETGAVEEPGRQLNLEEIKLRYPFTWRMRVGRVWARYLLKGRKRGVDELIDFLYSNYFFVPQQLPGELKSLGKILAELKPRRALEIGTGQGGTLLFLTHLASPKATIVSVDLEGSEIGAGYSEERQWFYEHFGRRRQRLHLLRGDSHTFWMPKRVRESLRGQPLDYLFIDGDHRYEGVKKDFETYARLVRRGGVIALHDIADGENSGGVPEFWREIKQEFRHEEFIEGPQQAGNGIGVLYVD